MICTLPYVMLYKHVFYLNSLSKEFGKLLAFACVYVCMYNLGIRKEREEKKGKKKKLARPSYRSKRQEKGKERKEKKRI